MFSPWKSPKLRDSASGVATVLAFAAGIAILANHTIRRPPNQLWNHWAVSEWLIDYDAGFIRRGLVGSLISHFRHGGSAFPFADHMVFSLGALLAFFFALLLLLSPKSGGAVRLLALAAPFGLVAMILENSFIYRKEILFQVCLALSGAGCLLLARLRPVASGFTAFLRPLLLAFMICVSVVLPLVHETFLFLSAPAFLILMCVTAAPYSWFSARILAGWYAAFEVLLFAVLSYFKGDAHAARIIWLGLNPSDVAMIAPTMPFGVPMGGIAALGWKLSRQLHDVANILFTGAAWFWAMHLLASALYCAAILSLARLRERSASHLSAWPAIYAFIVAMGAPLYLIATDWGRWIATGNLSFLIVFLAVSEDDAGAVLCSVLGEGPSIASWRTAMLGIADRILAHPVALAVFAGCFALTGQLPECCVNTRHPSLNFELLEAIRSIRSLL